MRFTFWPHLSNQRDSDVRAIPVAAMRRRLRCRIPVMHQTLDVTRQPGLSIGVIHLGHEVLKYNFVVKDVESGLPPDSDTLYCIASLSKAFMSASLDLLVEEEKISWDSPVISIVPELRHVQQENILSHMTIRDICSHRTGLDDLDEIIQGLNGRILLPKEKLIQICNTLPIRYDLRTSYLYNNALYELAGHIVERTSKYSNWGDFQRDRIFSPLDMTRTTAFRSVHWTDDNICHSIHDTYERQALQDSSYRIVCGFYERGFRRRSKLGQ